MIFYLKFRGTKLNENNYNKKVKDFFLRYDFLFNPLISNIFQICPKILMLFLSKLIPNKFGILKIAIIFAA